MPIDLETIKDFYNSKYDYSMKNLYDDKYRTYDDKYCTYEEIKNATAWDDYKITSYSKSYIDDTWNNNNDLLDVIITPIPKKTVPVAPTYNPVPAPAPTPAPVPVKATATVRIQAVACERVRRQIELD
jgi:hypothetical protein